MRKWILTILIVLALTSLTFAADPNSSGQGSGVSLVGRAALAYQTSGLNAACMVGVRKNLTIPDISGEVGGIVSYLNEEAQESLQTVNNDIDSRLGLGVYGLLKYSGDVEIPNPFADLATWMPDTLVGKPFAGGGWLDNTGAFWLAGATVGGCLDIYWQQDANQGDQHFLGVTANIPLKTIGDAIGKLFD